MKIIWILLILVIGTGIQSEGGKISQLDINFSHEIYLSGNYIYDNILINGTHYFITTEIPQNVQNPFINEGFLYYEVV
jgi:hypothetical protein